MGEAAVEHERVVDELKRARRAGLAQLDQLEEGGRKKWESRCPNLVRFAETLEPSLSRQSAELRVGKVIRHAIGRLTSTDPEDADRSVVTWNASLGSIMRTLFGAESDSNESPDLLRDRARQMYVEAFGLVSKVNWERSDGGRESVLLSQLASQVLTDQEATEAPPQIPASVDTALARAAAGSSEPVLSATIVWMSDQYGGFQLALDRKSQDAIATALQDVSKGLPPRYEEFLRSYVERGAYISNGAVVRLGVSNGADAPIRITNVRLANLERVAIPDGLFLGIGAQGSARNLRLRFDLDADDPVALVWLFDSIDRAGDPYFRDRSISIQPQDAEVVAMLFQTDGGACDFYLELEYLLRGKLHRTLVGSDGSRAQSPFRVSCFPHNGKVKQNPEQFAAASGTRYEHVWYRDITEECGPKWATGDPEDFARSWLD